MLLNILAVTTLRDRLNYPWIYLARSIVYHAFFVLSLSDVKGHILRPVAVVV